MERQLSATSYSCDRSTAVMLLQCSSTSLLWLRSVDVASLLRVDVSLFVSNMLVVVQVLYSGFPAIFLKKWYRL